MIKFYHRLFLLYFYDVYNIKNYTMKFKIILSLLVLTVVFTSCDNNENTKTYFTISSIEDLSKPLVVVSSYGNDTLVFKDSIVNYSLDKFTSGQFVKLVSGRVVYPLYFKSNLPFSISINDSQSFKSKDVTYLGKGAEVQSYLLSVDKQTDELFLKYDFQNMSEKNLEHILDSISVVKLGLENNIEINDAFLKHNLSASVFYFNALIKTYYLFWKADEKSLYSPKDSLFLSFKKDVVYNDDQLVDNSTYIDYLMIDLESDLYGNGESPATSSIEMLKLLEKKKASPLILNKLSFNITERHIKANKANFTKETVAIFKKLNTNSQNIAKIEEDVKAISKFFPGEKAPSFTFETKDKELVSLSDFKGKLVYLDFWATWCGPCRKEIPFLKELEHDYTDKEIVFISISIDRLSDYEKWKLMLVENEMSGIQVYAGNETPVLAEYDIQFIPRFVLIDKEGRFINSSAPKPSSIGEIRTLINDYLSQ